jgi:hypothetical protein
MSDDAPEGYRYVWVPDESSRMGGEGRKCRMLRCPNQAVVAFQRKAFRRLGPRFHRWHYSADHLYGRKIEGGVVKVRRLVKIKEAEVQP